MAKEEIPRGQLSTIILYTLFDNDKYGYEIIDTIKEKTNGAVCIKQPSLYSSLRRMEEQGLISSYWRDSEIGGRRHYYSITDYGRKYAEKWQVDLSSYTSLNSQAHKNEKREESIKAGTILQQGNLFEIGSSKEKSNVDEPMDVEDKSFVQYDLFSSPTLIADPSDELFDSIKKLREEADDENKPDSSKVDMISSLRNINQEDIKTTYVADNHNIDNNKVRNSFFELSKKQKSFADAVKNQEEVISVDEEKSFDEFNKDYSNTETESEENKLETNIEKTNIVDDEYLQETENKEQVFDFYNIEDKPVEDKPTIYQDTKQFDVEEENVDAPAEFIDLNNLSFIENNKSETQDIELNNEQESNITYSNEVISTKPTNVEQSDNKANSSPALETHDDAIYITERPVYEDVPKVKKIAPARFENYNYNKFTPIDSRISKLFESKKSSQVEQEQQTEPEIKEEPISEPETQTISKIKNLYDLQKYYNNQGVKFGIYEKQNICKNNNYVKSNVLKLISYSAISLLSIIISIIMFCCCKDIQVVWNWTYLVFPFVFVGFAVYYLVKFISNKNTVMLKSNFINNNWIFKVVVSIVICLIVFSINLLCGMNFDNISEFLTTLLYPCLLMLCYSIIPLIDYILIKFRLVK